MNRPNFDPYPRRPGETLRPCKASDGLGPPFLLADQAYKDEEGNAGEFDVSSGVLGLGEPYLNGKVFRLVHIMRAVADSCQQRGPRTGIEIGGSIDLRRGESLFSLTWPGGEVGGGDAVDGAAEGIASEALIEMAWTGSCRRNTVRVTRPRPLAPADNGTHHASAWAWFGLLGYSRPTYSAGGTAPRPGSFRQIPPYVVVRIVRWLASVPCLT